MSPWRPLTERLLAIEATVRDLMEMVAELVRRVTKLEERDRRDIDE